MDSSGKQTDALHGTCENVTFRSWHWIRHAGVFTVFAILCAIQYSHVTGAPFQFDDEPNITNAPCMAMQTLTLENLTRSIREAEAPNRILVSLTFSLQHWAAQFLPRGIDDAPPRPDFLAWQFRMFNYLVHLFAGFFVYIFFLKLFQLPLAEKHITRHAWPLAMLTAFIWFCSPLQTQAVTYIVQRATSMATLFYIAALVSYLEARAGTTPHSKIAYFALSLLCGLGAVFCKEIAVTLVLAVPLLEFLLICNTGPQWLWQRLRKKSDTVPNPKEEATSRRSLGWILIALLAFGTVDAMAISWFFGSKHKATTLTQHRTSGSPVSAFKKLGQQLFTWVMEEKENISAKIPLTPRQRLLTETRVVAMYQSLLLLPLPSRQSLDYDFPESKDTWGATEGKTLRQWIPLLLILFIVAATAYTPGRWRAATFLFLVTGLTLWDAYSGHNAPSGLAGVWRFSWPVPALVWHGLALSCAALYSYRRPLLAFAIFFFYLGHLVESTVIILEVVFEHRLYLPSVGFYLVMLLLLFEVFFPPRTEDLGPHPWKGNTHV